MPDDVKADEAAPLINPNPSLQAYYRTLESRIGYWLMLGGTRHFGYWERDTYWPFPISASLRRMEDKLGEILAVPNGSRVLDAGCGDGHVALRLARTRALDVVGIDIVERHVAHARRNVARAYSAKPPPAGSVRATVMDYHHLETLETASFDGVYTCETLVHATDPAAVLSGFYRLLKPGGRIAMHEYDHELPTGDERTGLLGHLADAMEKVNRFSAMPTNAAARPGVYKELLEAAGFEDVVVRDLSYNIRPITRLFFVVALVPYLFILLFGLERRFVNTVAGVGAYCGYGHWRYLAISARKPGEPLRPAGKV